MRARHKLSYNNKSYSEVAAPRDCFLLSTLAVCLSLFLSPSLLSLCVGFTKTIFSLSLQKQYQHYSFYMKLLSELIDFPAPVSSYSFLCCSELHVFCPSLPKVIPLGHSMCSDTRTWRSTPFSPDFSILA